MVNLAGLAPTEPLRVIVGASSQSYPGWIQTQEDELNLLMWELWQQQGYVIGKPYL